MPCEEHFSDFQKYENESYFKQNYTMFTFPPVALLTDEEDNLALFYEMLRFSIKNVCLPIIFVLGIVGNIVNLLVLARKRFRKGLDGVERSALAGLIFLAVSDLMFCVVGFLGSVLMQEGPSGIVSMYYGLYSTGLLNIFLFSSTWMTVAISLERYLAVCHPFLARRCIRTRRTVGVHFGILLSSVVLNLPLFLEQEVTTAPCAITDSCQCHFVIPTEFALQYPQVLKVHDLMWAILGTCVPFMLLLVSNIKIILVVCRTAKNSEGISDVDERRKHRDAIRVTMSLVAMVITFLVLVGPSMILTFLTVVSSSDNGGPHSHTIALLITNFCQAVKFATNFVLYCITNKQFRQQVRGAVCRTLQATRPPGPEEIPLQVDMLEK